MADILAPLAFLIGLALALGVENTLITTIFVSRLKKEPQQRARVIGLRLALVEILQMRYTKNKLAKN